jgi:lipopolysaccharide/colanic/teichoic acid biosynthesis glycosyltransferase
MIYKFRSMKHDAEEGSPRLSAYKDPRNTVAGSFLRRYRLDELPNLVNVIRGEMQLIGPRPERQFYIDQIIKRDARFLRLLKISPGITSWGQVRYGYATNVDQMLERMEFDLYFLEHRSIIFEIKIALLTVATVLKGKGI